MTIDFLPSNSSRRDITKRLLKVLKTSYGLEGSVAFWTLDKSDFSGKLLKALSQAGSTMCVDLHWPTNLKKIAGFVEKLAQKRTTPVFYICLRKQVDDTNREIVSLLHTKLLLFNLGDNEWEIWVGSHNFTMRALKGRNVEASIVLRGRANEPKFKPLLKQVQAYLADIKRFCEPFDPHQITTYEALRGEVNKEELKDKLAEELAAKIAIEEILISRVLSLQCDQANTLSGQTIIILGNLFDELAILRQRNRGGSPVFLRVLDSDSGEIYTYEGRIRAFDNIDTVPSSNVAFNQRRWAFRYVTTKGEATTPPFLYPSQDVGPNLIASNQYYVNVEIIELVTKQYIGYYTYPETDTRILWKPIEQRLVPTPAYNESTQMVPFINASAVEFMMEPVSDAEELTLVRSIPWDLDYKDGLLERRILVFGKKK